MARALMIQSSVIEGHVGAQAALFPLQRRGVEAMAAPTAILTGHAARRGVAGRMLTAAELAALGDGLAAQGALDRLDAVSTGYLGSEALADAAFSIMDRAPAAALRMVDPVLGDDGPGLYLPEAVGRRLRMAGLPRADAIVPNAFEAGWLTDRAIVDTPGALEAADSLRALGPDLVFITSAPAGPGRIGLLAVNGQGAWLAAAPRIDHRAHGAGDMLAALILADLLEGLPPARIAGRAAGALCAVIAEAARLGADALPIVSAQEIWLNAPPARVDRLR